MKYKEKGTKFKTALGYPGHGKGLLSQLMSKLPAELFWAVKHGVVAHPRLIELRSSRNMSQRLVSGVEEEKEEEEEGEEKEKEKEKERSGLWAVIFCCVNHVTEDSSAEF